MDRKLCLSRSNKIVAGVCGGIAEYFKVDPTLIRIIWVIVALLLKGVPLIIIYVVCWAIMPVQKIENNLENANSNNSRYE